MIDQKLFDKFVWERGLKYHEANALLMYLVIENEKTETTVKEEAEFILHRSIVFLSSVQGKTCEWEKSQIEVLAGAYKGWLATHEKSS